MVISRDRVNVGQHSSLVVSGRNPPSSPSQHPLFSVFNPPTAAPPNSNPNSWEGCMTKGTNRHVILPVPCGWHGGQEFEGAGGGGGGRQEKARSKEPTARAHCQIRTISMTGSSIHTMNTIYPLPLCTILDWPSTITHPTADGPKLPSCSQTFIKKLKHCSGGFRGNIGLLNSLIFHWGLSILTAS